MTPPPQRQRIKRAAPAIVLTDWPTGDDWYTVEQLADHYARIGALPLPGGVPLEGVLSHARRQGWVLRNRRGPADTFRMTPKGGAYAATARATQDPA